MAPLPPFAALRAFDAAARHLSFRDAAEELGLTPTAVSHQIRRLEDLADAKLFQRRVRAVALTDAGTRFAAEIAPSLRAIEASFAALRKTEEKRVVVIGAGPVFLSRWMAPRLSAFAATYPDIDLRLHNSPADLWRRADEFDISIAWGRREWPDRAATPLLHLTATPLVAPSLIEGRGALGAADILELPLLHHWDDGAWRNWFARHGLSLPAHESATFEDANVLSHAANCGQGVMLGCASLFGDDIRAGRLAKPFEEAQPVDAAYYLLSPNRHESAASVIVRDWLLHQAAVPGA